MSTRVDPASPHGQAHDERRPRLAARGSIDRLVVA
jgi:hypothetical protein